MTRSNPSTLAWALVAIISGWGAMPGSAAEVAADGGKDQAAQVLESVARFYGERKDLSVTAVMKAHYEAQGRKRSAERRFQIAMQRPNRFRFATVDAGDGGGVVSSDGEKFSVFLRRLGKYTEADSPGDLEKILQDRFLLVLSSGSARAIGALLRADPAGAVVGKSGEVRYLGRETLAGQPHHRLALRGEDEAVIWWVSAGDRPLVHRIEIDLSARLKAARAAGQKLNMSLVYDLVDWKIDAGLEKAAFAFKPPEAVKKVASFDRPAGPAGGAHTLVGKPAADFSLPRLEGGEAKLAAHRDQQVVILDFWATWCGPCVRAMPILADVADGYRDKGVVFYAVNQKEAPEKINQFLQRSGLDLTVLLDRDGAVARAYGVRGIPQTVIIDREGTVQAVHVGFSPDLKQKLIGELDALLAGKKLAE
ncbi:MAG: redoxin domain-containing protein [Phycisphaerae bacterium]|nr:redoxin domain-containing protein [Phycisphaerae bacterium]